MFTGYSYSRRSRLCSCFTCNLQIGKIHGEFGCKKGWPERMSELGKKVSCKSLKGAIPYQQRLPLQEGNKRSLQAHYPYSPLAYYTYGSLYLSSWAKYISTAYIFSLVTLLPLKLKEEEKTQLLIRQSPQKMKKNAQSLCSQVHWLQLHHRMDGSECKLKQPHLRQA